MRAKFVNEGILDGEDKFDLEKQPEGAVTCTVDEFFTWYNGSEGWEDEEEVTNSMAVSEGDSDTFEHAQDDGAEGMNTLRWLEVRKDEIIDVYSTFEHNSYSLYFELDGKHFDLQSISPALSKNYE